VIPWFWTVWPAAILFIVGPAAAADYASWLQVEYPPIEDRLESIALKKIERTWSKVLVLTKGNQPPEVLKDVERNEAYGFRFQVEGDFNKDGRKDKALVGVYRDKRGVTGRFFLVLTKTRLGAWKKAFLYTQPGKPGFGILTWDKGRVNYYQCMECGFYADLVWEEGAYKLRWSSGAKE